MSGIIIPIKSLAHARQQFEFIVNEQFMSGFGKNEIMKADCNVVVEAEKKSSWVEIVCRIDGEVVVPCDRCLDPLTLPIEVEELLTVRFDEDAEDVVEEDDNILILNNDQNDLDLGQCVYDFICLSLPLQKVHSEGECNPEVVSRIGHGEQKASAGNSPFSELKKMLENNNN